MTAAQCKAARRKARRMQTRARVTLKDAMKMALSEPKKAKGKRKKS